MMKKWLAGVLAAAMCLVGAVAAAECAHGMYYWNGYYAHWKYIQTDSPTEHIVVSDYYTDKYCQDCGERIHGIQLQEEGVRENRPHVFTNQGICAYCNYGSEEEACAHNNVTHHENEMYFIAYEKWDAMYHAIVRDCVSYDTCMDCWETLNYVVHDR